MKDKELKQKLIEILEEADILSFEKEFKIVNRILKLFPDRDEMVKRLEGEKREVNTNMSRAEITSLYGFNHGIKKAIKIIKGDE